ncbi:MAG: segregation/condensation protein A [Coriobacteriaceae bacterium]|nr:segregation/condensation protein A [Coriobacteriaceae bacterium]
MAYRVRTESFEGPFDLLLYLVNRQRVDIGSVNISQIANQYLDEIARMKRLDLDVASDFLVVASTLLEIKAASLVDDDAEDDPELEDIGPAEAREVLLGRLLEYKKYKNAAAALKEMHEQAGRRHARTFGAPAEFLGLMPDYLEGVSLEDLARYYVACYTRRDAFLLESEHIAGKPIAVEGYVKSLHERVRSAKRFRFSDVVAPDAPTAVVVVTFLAILELVKRNMVTVRQEGLFGDIEVSYIEGSGELADSGPIDAYGEVR